MNQKYIPLRTCAVTGNKLPKNAMFRIVKNQNQQIEIDLTQNKVGRGAYISKDIDTIKLGKKRNSLSRTLRCRVDGQIYDLLLNELERK